MLPEEADHRCNRSDRHACENPTVTVHRQDRMKAIRVTDDETLRMTVSGGPALADYMGDFVLEIEVPDEIAAPWEVKEEPPKGWPFREYWLAEELANEYRHTLVVYRWAHDVDLEQVPPELVGK